MFVGVVQVVMKTGRNYHGTCSNRKKVLENMRVNDWDWSECL